jgi:chaperonin GroEL (HSP60 family)
MLTKSDIIDSYFQFFRPFITPQMALDNFRLEDEDEQIGVEIVGRAPEEPLRQIAQNAGHEGSIVVEKVRANNSASFGFNAARDEYGDPVQMGVIDPRNLRAPRCKTPPRSPACF